ncbi:MULTISPECIES: TlpA disulfide reductase family protein [Pedobacter]|uniref:TlpA family protein disulfide reductase n=1 Tax=Pedobacter TaxID=84567 RepID=UPI001E63B550|nr:MULTISPECIES: TlpA disulfide reductase family protein [Pedobacter]
MKKLTLLSFLVCITYTVFAQYNPSQHANYFNGFQRTKYTNPDSAIYFLTNLAMLESNATDDLLHNTFAQSFMLGAREELLTDPEFLAHLKKSNVTVDSARRKFNEEQSNAYIILDKTKNSVNKQIKENIYPIWKWVESIKNKDNTIELQKIGNEYLSYLNEDSDFYIQRKARYGLMISGLMNKNDKLKPTAYKLQEVIYNNLNQYITNHDTQSEMSRDEKMDRAWYRYMFAALNFISAGNTTNKADQIKFLKLASEYSPDAIDNTVKSAYFYDMFFLFNKEKYSFEDDYLATLASDEDKLKMVMAMSMKDPKYKASAKALYKEPGKFSEYWLTEFNKNGKVAPLFSLKKLDGSLYQMVNNSNQWTLVDFWGTWCSPCRKEHPDLQSTYQKTQDAKLPKLNIITIASNDKESAVRAYMKEFNYTFPVAMSDNQIESAYKVSSWPSKFLVSPQGKYVVIPFGVDWQKYITDYMN